MPKENKEPATTKQNNGPPTSLFNTAKTPTLTPNEIWRCFQSTGPKLSGDP